MEAKEGRDDGSGDKLGREEDGNPTVTGSGSVDGSILKSRTTAVSIPDTSRVMSVSVPFTTSGSFPFHFPTIPHPVTIPVPNALHQNPVPWIYTYSTPHTQNSSTQGGTTGEQENPGSTSHPPPARSNIKPPSTMPLKEDISTEPRKPNIKPPSTMPLEGDIPPELRLHKRRVTITPPFTPMSIGVRETEWVQLTQLGLGKALDATNPHPWASKSSYQAKEVQVCDLVLTNEGQRLINYVKVIDNYFNILGSLEGSIRLPHQPIEIGVAADTHRSYCQTQEIRGKTVYTRTIAFNITADAYSKSSSDDYKTPFQHQLELHLEREHEKMEEEERDSVSDTTLCLDFLHSLGGITHYVSSITLGAMEYSVKKVQALDIGSTVNSRAGFGPMAGALASKTLMVRKTRRKQVQHNEKIGRISENDRVSPHSHDEAVIHYSITSLANLVTDQRLREHVQKAIQTYITTRLHKINGPYYIMTPERLHREKNIYWQVVEERERGVVTHYIRHTMNREEASTFFIRPDYRKVAKYFFITTFDTPRLTSVATATTERFSHPPPSEASSVNASHLHQDADNGSGGTLPAQQHNAEGVIRDCGEYSRPTSGYYGYCNHGNSIIRRYVSQSHVERYVHISRNSFFKHFPTSTRIVMKAKAAVRPHFARFQLVDRRDRMAKTLLESDWLPDECELQGQPFFLRQYYHLTKCVGIAGLGETRHMCTRGDFHFTLSNMSSHREGRCHMLFQLVRAEKIVSNHKNTD